MPIPLIVNGQNQSLDLPPDMPLLWALREGLNLTGTKFGCGQALCGACTVPLRPGTGPGFTVSKAHLPVEKSVMTRPQPRNPSSTAPPPSS